MRSIKIADSKKRDTEVFFGKSPSILSIKYQMPNGEEVKNLKVLKSPVDFQFQSLLNIYKKEETLIESIIKGNPEIDLKTVGTFIHQSQRILINENHKPISEVIAKEKIFSADGSLAEERLLFEKEQNIKSEFPVKWTGKYILIKEAYNKFIFSRRYQLSHTDGLSYDFLFEMAKDLDEKQSLMLLGAGPKGNEPLIFQTNGKPYRAFLQGKINGEGYLLLLHLSNMELKPIL